VAKLLELLGHDVDTLNTLVVDVSRQRTMVKKADTKFLDRCSNLTEK
jgi:hypothetical protein